jgi:hypothetical protein
MTILLSMSTVAKPQWDGNWNDWVTAWRAYFSARYASIWSKFRASPKATADDKALADDLTNYAIEKVETLSPGLYELGQRYYSGVNDTDKALAYYYMSMYPQVPLAEGKYPPKGLTGYEGVFPIEMYTNSQVYDQALNCLILLNKSRRVLDRASSAQIAQAISDQKYTQYRSSDPGWGRMPPGFPIEVYALMAAQSYAGFMTLPELGLAQSWLQLKNIRAIQSDTSPMPGDPGYVPLPPTENTLNGVSDIPERRHDRN